MQINKSHIKQYQRRTKSGALVTVREHDDKRTKNAKVVGSPRQHKQFIAEVNKITKNFTHADQYREVVKKLRTLNAWRKRSGVSDSLMLRAKRAIRKRHADLVNHGKKNGEFIEENGMTIRYRKGGGKQPEPNAARSELDTKADNTDGLKDLPDPLRKKCERAKRGEGGEISLNTDEVKTLLRKGVVGFVSAGKSPYDDDRVDQIMRNEELKKNLKELGYKYLPVTGKYGEEEDSFMIMVPDARKDDLIHLGGKYNQESVLITDHLNNELIYTVGEEKGKVISGKGLKILRGSAKDNYTEVKAVDGVIKFSLNLNFKAAKSLLIKGKLGSQNPQHKYIRRKGSPGKYVYDYGGTGKSERPKNRSVEQKGIGNPGPPLLFSEYFKNKENIITSKTLNLDLITPDPEQPRKQFDKDKLKELGSSIKQLGLMQDIVVRPDPDNKGHYVIIAGERRYRASKLVGIKELPAKIFNTTDKRKIFALQTAENIARAEMNPIETGNAYAKLINIGFTPEEVAAKVGTSTATVERKLSLITLVDDIRDLIKTGNLSEQKGYIIALGRLSDTFQRKVLAAIRKEKLSDTALRGIVGRYKSAMDQVTLFGDNTEEVSTITTTHKTRRKQIKKDITSLLNDFSSVITRLSEAERAKLLPAIAKEEGQLAVITKKVEMLTRELQKINKELKWAKGFFDRGGTVAGYLTHKKLDKKKKKKRKSRIRKSIEGFIKPGHKYLKRTGKPGKYRYYYDSTKVKADTHVLLDKFNFKVPRYLPAYNKTNSYQVKFDFKWGNANWKWIKDEVKRAGAKWIPNEKAWIIHASDVDSLIDKFGDVAISQKIATSIKQPPKPKKKVNAKKVLNKEGVIPVKKTSHRKDVVNPGSKGSIKWWVDAKGKIRYGDKPKGARQLDAIKILKDRHRRADADLIQKYANEGDRGMFDYVKDRIEGELKAYVESQRAEKGSGAMKPSIFLKKRGEITDADVLAVIQFMKDKKILRIPTRGRMKGLICFDHKFANMWTVKSDGDAHERALEVADDLRPFDHGALYLPIPSQKIRGFRNVSPMARRVSDAIRSANAGENQVVQLMFSESDTAAPKTKKNNIFEKLNKLQRESAKQDRFRNKVLKAFKKKTGTRIAAMKAKYDLWGHQWQYVNWMLAANKGVVGADTGLGKTLMSLAYTKEMQARGVIDGAVAFLPRAVMYDWETEYKKFFKGKPKILYIDGTPEERKRRIASIKPGKYDFIIASHGMFQRGQTELKRLMAKTKKRAIFYDECHKGLMNPNNNAYKNFKKHVKQKHVFLLTGTPTRNEPMDLLRLSDLLYEGWLGNAKAFHANYYTKIRGKYYPDQNKMSEMWEVVKHIVPVMNKYSAGVKLPKRHDKTETVTMADDQKRYYQAAEASFLNAILAVDNPDAMTQQESTHIFAVLGSLRRAAYDPRMINPKYTGPSVMWDRSKELISDHLVNPNNKGVIVASAFVKPFPTYVKHLQKELGLKRGEIGVITGNTKSQDRTKIKNDMNSGKVKVLLMGMGAGGVGMNLQKGADMMITMADPWTYADKKQSIDRIIRPGSGSENVIIVDYNIPGTITEMVRDKIDTKETMHKMGDIEGAEKEKAMTKEWTFDDFMKLAGIKDRKQWASMKKNRGRKPKARKSILIRANFRRAS